jgi:hypothetical protein
MTARRLVEVAGCGLARNMSAPPRSTVSFRPYGTGAEPAGKTRPATENAGLRHVLRADPDALLLDRLPGTVHRMRELRQEGLDAARWQGKAEAAERVARVRALRLASLIALASSLDGAGRGVTAESLADETLESLQDRLVDWAGRLPLCPALPAMAVAESLAGGSMRGDPASLDALPVLWALTHLNGRTFDRDGLPSLAPDLADGGAWDFYAP